MKDNMQLTENEIDILKKYEDRMRTAVYSDYARNIISTDLERLRLIYNKALSVDYKLNKTCASCQLTFLKKLGEWWFNYKTVLKEPEPILIINELENKATNKERCQRKRKKKN